MRRPGGVRTREPVVGDSLGDDGGCPVDEDVAGAAVDTSADDMDVAKAAGFTRGTQSISPPADEWYILRAMKAKTRTQ